MRQLTVLVVSLAALAILAAPASAQPPTGESAGPSFPANQGYVTDAASLITSAEKTRLENLLGELERATGAQLAVVTVPTTKPLSVDEYAVDLFTRWGIGKKGRDNGVLVVVARDDRAFWIEVGYGLEGAIPDATAHRISQETIVPAFQAGQYGEGLERASLELAQLIAAEYGVTLESAKEWPARPAQGTRRTGIPVGALIALVVVFLLFGRRGGLLWLLLFGLPGGGRRGGFGGGGWGGHSGGFGGFGGGFGGFGGGATGGGGAGGNW